jgi:streptogramin lyase
MPLIRREDGSLIEGSSALRNVLISAASFAALLVSGCSVKPGFNLTPTEPSPVSGAALRGLVHGGQQPIVGAHVYLLAANTTGYGDASVSLLTSGPGRSVDGSGNYYVTTGSGGIFNISGDYDTCPASNTQVYLYSVGGNPGLGSANAAAGLLAALGTCGNLTTTENIVVNEVSTIATAYAIAGFATDALHVSSSNSALAELGIQDAFSAAANLEQLSTGAALATTPAGNGAAPQQEINTLADILAACVNTSGPTSSPCTTLLTNAKNGNTAPTDTATAAINIAHNPVSNLDALYGLWAASGPFQPSLPGEPTDFTVAITYSGSGLDSTTFLAPNGIAIDGYGNVWLPNYDSNSVSKFKFDGTVLSGATGFTGAGLDQPTSIAIDIYGNAWIANFNAANFNDITSISEFSSTGVDISGPPGYEGSGLNEPYGIAIDNLSHTWVSNNGGNNLSEFTSSGTPLSGLNGFDAGTIAAPGGVAADTAGNVWTVDYGAAIYILVESNASGSQTGDPSGFSGGGLNAPYGVAIDHTGNVWVSNLGGNGSVSEFSSSGTAISGADGFSGGGISGPYGIAIDGAGNVWTANQFNYTISEFNQSGTAISSDNGYTSAELIAPYAIAIDPSGNVWTATNNGNASLTEFVGAAVPVVTPLAAGAEYNELGLRP